MDCSGEFDNVLLVEGGDVDQIIRQMATNRQQANRTPPAHGTGFVASAMESPPMGRLSQARAHGAFFARSVWLSLALLAAPGSANPRGIVQRHCAAFLRRLGEMGQLYVEFEGFEDAADWRGSVVCPNHPSLLDALFLFSKIPEVDCVIGRNPWRDPLLAVPARRAGYVPSEPAGMMLRECRRRLEDGGNIVIFPEGTRTADGVLNGFQGGFALPAIQSGGSVRTVFIECDSMALGKGFSFFRNAHPPLRFRISTGEVFTATRRRRAREFSREIEWYFRANLHRDGDRISRVAVP